MFDARQAITHLANAGVTLATDGERLEVVYRYPLTDRQWSWLKARKRGLIWQLIHGCGSKEASQ